MKKIFSVFPPWILLTTFIVIVFILILFVISYYNVTKNAKGFEDEIYVVSDSLEYEKLKDPLESTFEKEIYTPQPEKVFTLKRVDPSEIEKYKDKKNILLLAPLNSGSDASNLVESVVDSSTKNKLLQDSNLIVYKNDLWAKDQLVTVISAPTTDQLESKLSQNAGKVMSSFQRNSDKRLRSYLYNPDYEQKDVEGSFLKQYGWTIYVHPEYKIASESPGEKFVWLKKSRDDELDTKIFIYWIDNAPPEYLTGDSIKAVRNRLTKEFYRTTKDTSYVVVAEDYFMVNEVSFNKRYAILTQGLWELDTKSKTGPFINYTFYDEKSKRLYMLDGSIFAPKYYKRNLIQQVDVILQSFMTETELSKERKEELLEAAEDYKPLY
jgi:hypothetical protein